MTTAATSHGNEVIGHRNEWSIAAEEVADEHSPTGSVLHEAKRLVAIRALAITFPTGAATPLQPRQGLPHRHE